MPPRRRRSQVPRPQPIRVAKAPSLRPVGDALEEVAKAVKRTEKYIPKGPPLAQRRQPHQPGPRRPRVPPLAQDLENVRNGPWDEFVLGGDTPAPPRSDTPEDIRGARAEQIRMLSPTPSSNPTRPRTLEASYDPVQQILTVRFREGGTYNYHAVPPRVWFNLVRNRSFGKGLDRNVIGQYQYEKIGAS